MLMMMIQVNVEPGITIGFLNRLLVAEGLSLAVVPEVFIMVVIVIRLWYDEEYDKNLGWILIMIMMQRMQQMTIHGHHNHTLV